MARDENTRIISSETIEEYSADDHVVDKERDALCCTTGMDSLYCGNEGKVETWVNGDIKEDPWPASTIQLIKDAKEDPLLEVIIKSRKNPCGTTETEYVFNKNCCGDNTTPYFIQSVEELEPGAETVFIVAGGSGDYVWSVGIGLSIVGSNVGDTVRIKATTCLCEVTYVGCIDSCDVAVYQSVALDAPWTQIELSELPGAWQTDGVETSDITWSGAGATAIAVEGRFKAWTSYWSNSAGGTYFFKFLPEVTDVPDGCDDSNTHALYRGIYGDPGDLAHAYATPKGYSKLAVGVYCVYSEFEFYPATGPLGDGFDGQLGMLQIKYSGTNQLAWEQKCDLVELLYNDEESVEIIAQDSSGYIYWQGGTPPYIVHLSGDGFFTDKNWSQKEAQTTGNSLIIRTNEESCGTCIITITDACEQVEEGSVKSSGYWDSIGTFRPVYSMFEPGFIYSACAFPIEDCDRGSYGGKTVNYNITSGPMETTYSGPYAMQSSWTDPDTFVRFSASTGNQDAKCNSGDEWLDCRYAVPDPIVGVFDIYAIAGIEHRANNYKCPYMYGSIIQIYEFKC